MMAIYLMVLFTSLLPSKLRMKELVSASQLLVDPLSISVNGDLFRLCWNQSENHDLGYLSISKYAQSEEQILVFNDSQTSNKTYCIEKREQNTKYKVKLPLTKDPESEYLNLIVTFSSSLGPPLNIIRFKKFPKGIQFQIHHAFSGITSSEKVTCEVILLYQTAKTSYISKFVLETSKDFQRKYVTLEPGSAFTIYSSCIIRNAIDVSSQVVKHAGGTFPEDRTKDLQPFLPLFLKRFIVALWKHPPVIPKSYNIVLYERFEPNLERCLKIFRLCNSHFVSENKCEIFAKSAENCVMIEDLGYFQHDRSGNLYAVLDMENLLKSNSEYKLAIFWKENEKEIQENYIYFSPLPNENCGIIRKDFLNFRNDEYDEIRNMLSELRQNVISQHPVNPVLRDYVKFSMYDKMAFLPTISVRNGIRLSDVSLNRTHDYPRDCQSQIGCSNGFYPFYYVLLISKEQFGEMQAEIVQVAKSEGSELERVFVSPNDQMMTFTISWKVERGGHYVMPALYVIELVSGISETCHSVYVLKCRTCNRHYKKISEDFLKEHRHWKTHLIKYLDNQYDALDNRISFTTDIMPQLLNFQAKVYPVTLQSLNKPVVSKSVFIKELTWKKYGFISVGLIFCVFVVILLLVFYRYKKKKELFLTERRKRQLKIQYTPDEM